MSYYKKADYLAMSRDRITAFRKIADTLGKDHSITKMMGGLAWGRHPAEQGPQPTLHTAVHELGYLQGCFHILNLWARDNDRNAQRIMSEYWPHGMRKAA